MTFLSHPPHPSCSCLLWLLLLLFVLWLSTGVLFELIEWLIEYVHLMWQVVYIRRNCFTRHRNISNTSRPSDSDLGLRLCKVTVTYHHLGTDRGTDWVCMNASYSAGRTREIVYTKCNVKMWVSCNAPWQLVPCQHRSRCSVVVAIDDVAVVVVVVTTT